MPRRRSAGHRPRRGAAGSGFADEGATRAPTSPQPPIVPHPAQLRRTLAGSAFIGRQAELGQLDEMLAGMAAGDTPGSAAVTVIHGMAGIGKTQLGLFWAHRRKAEFPDGQLFADLHGFESGGEPAAAGDVLRSMVRDLGLPAHLTGTGDELVGQFRSLTAGRRLLIFLDNARDAAQVEPLIPASEDCLVLITSRGMLADLEGVGKRIGLGLLGVPEAISLLAAAVGTEFIEAAPGRAGRLVEATGRLTLALQVAAWRIAARHPLQRERELDRILAELASDTGVMAALDGASSQERQLTAVLTGSYQALPTEARQLFRALAAHPGVAFSGAAAIALAGRGIGDPERALGTLTTAHLAEPLAPDRYRLHDLVWAFVRQLAAGDADHTDATGRICSWYVHSARNADGALRPGRIRPALLPVSAGVTPAGFADRSAAFGWLDAEHENLAATVAHGVRNGHGAIVWPLPLDMWGYLTQTRRWAQWVAPHQQAADAAASAGHPSGQGWLLNNLGTVYRDLGQPGAARDAYAAGLAVRRSVGDLHGEADSLKDMALAARLAGDLAEGIRLSEDALAVMTRLEAPDLSGTASSLDNISAALTALGRLQEAQEARERALRLWGDIRGVRDDRAYARCIAGLAEIAWLRRDAARAESLYLQSLGIFEAIGDHWGQADTLHALGEVTAAAAPARARDYWERARARLEELGADEAADGITALLAALAAALPAGADVVVRGIDGAHVTGVVTLADAAAEVLLVQRAERAGVEFDAEAGRVGHPDRAAGEGQRRPRDDVLAPPREVGVAGVVQVRGRRGQVRHRGEADAEVGVGVHGHAEAEGLADPGEQLGPAQAAPVVRIRQDHLDGAGGDGRRQVLEGDHAHVGGQRHRGVRGHLGHPGDALGRVLQVLEHAVQLLRHPDRGGRRPGGVRVKPERMVGERGPQRADRLDLLLRGEDAALELERGEPVGVHQAAGLLDDAVGVERLAPAVWFLAGVRGPLIEKVGRERHRVPDRAAQQVGDGQANRLALDVQAGHLEGGEHRVGGRGVADRPRGDGVAALPDHLRDPPVDLLGVEGVHALDGVRDGAQRGQMVLVRVGLAQAGQAGVGGDLDDRAERERLVHADRVQQRGIGEGDRGDRDAADLQGADARVPLAHAPTAARPAARMARSSPRCSGDGSTSGGRTEPASRPRSPTPALTSETA